MCLNQFKNQIQKYANTSETETMAEVRAIQHEKKTVSIDS